MTASNIEILACEPSPLGLLCLRRRELLSAPGTFVTEITLEHEYLMSSLQTASERALATRALALHGEGEGCGAGPPEDWDAGELRVGPGSAGDASPAADLSVLVGGLGLGYTAREALASDRVGRMEVVERLRPVIDWMEQGLGPLAEELRADPRMRVIEGDVYGWLAVPPGAAEPGPGGRIPSERPAGPWDLILIDVDHSPDEPLDPANAWFYTEAGAVRVRERLAPRGVLGVWSFAPCERFEAALRSAFGAVCVEPVTFHNRLLDEEQTDWLFLARR